PAAARHVAPAFPAGCWQVSLAPSHWSRVHGLPSEGHEVPAGAFASAGQSVPVPVHVSCGSHAPADARHTTVGGWNPSAGQVLLDPVQVSATSQTSAAARHWVPAGWNVQSVLQQSPLVPLLAPSSHCSAPSTMPFPQPAV